MAKKTPPAAPEEASENILVTAAKGLGAAAGKIAALAGAKPETPKSPKNVKKPKLASKGKSRLPRKQKKALKLAESKQA
jgi:hypothetical protein